MQRKILLLASGILALIFPFSAFSFVDISGTSHEQLAVGFVADQGIVNGYSDGSYRPKNLINRAEFTKIVMGWLKKDSLGGTDCFPDVKSEWFSPHVCAAKKLGIIQGYIDGFFRPERNISLAEALKIVLETKKIQLAESASGTPWYQKYWNYALQNPAVLDAILPDPQHQLTRGEMASLVYNLSMSEFKAVMQQFGNEVSPLDRKPYLTQNYANLLENFYTMAVFGQDAEIAMLRKQTALLGVWSMPDPSTMKLRKSFVSGQNVGLIFEQEKDGYYAASCVSFKSESGWKIDWTRSAATQDLTKKVPVFENVSEDCKKSSPLTEPLQAADLILAKDTWSSEYDYEVYLNGTLIKFGGLQAGTTIRGLPLRKGQNELKVVLGKSHKDIISPDSSDPFMQLAKLISGFQYDLVVNEKNLISVELASANQTVVKSFSMD